MDAKIIIEIRIEVTDIEHLNMDEMLSAASQQGLATLIRFDREGKITY